MAPRAYWKGYLKLSLVSCPIALYPASSSSERVSFNRINKKTGNRLKQQNVDAETGEPIDRQDIGRGYEIGKGQYLQVADGELEKIEIESTHTIAIGSLPLGYYSDRQLVYAGRVGTGWSADLARSLRVELDRIKAKKPALGKPLPAGAKKGVSWAEPRLVCEIEFRDWTHDGLIRQAAFKGLRDDKLPEDISLEAPRGSKSGTVTDIAAAGLTHPERILWAEPGITKQGLEPAQVRTAASWSSPPNSRRGESTLSLSTSCTAKKLDPFRTGTTSWKRAGGR